MYTHLQKRQEKRCAGMVSVAREIEVKEQGEGSLSIPIVPLESWEISSTESQ